MCNIEKFMKCLAAANAVTVDDGALLTSWETATLTGSPDNQVVRFSWTDGECNYSDALTESGLRNALWREADGKVILDNADGDRTVVRFFRVENLLHCKTSPLAA